MSSGVPEQMKVPGNAAKNVEEKNIPWSQQVDETSYENLASPNDDNAATNTNSMQFQYPPFNAKENQNFSWDNYKNRKPSNNSENKKIGKPAFYNNSKRDDLQTNAWGTNNIRRIGSDNPTGNYNRSNRSDDSFPSGRLDNRPSVNFEDKKSNTSTVAAAVGPKKTTWASIASQPAKLTSRTTLATSSHKKKGPGMPPPPMVPGKHNLDVNTWDLPNNNPPVVPTPPPPIDIGQFDINPDPAASFIPEQHNLETRTDKAHKATDTFKEENKSNYNANYGRSRHSPTNGQSRKNWSTQHPLQPNRQPPSGAIRRGDGSVSSGDQTRYSERRNNQYANTRQDQGISLRDFKDENSPQSIDPPSSVTELPSDSPQAVLCELKNKNNYNPTVIDLEKAANARFFVIKSYSEDDIHRSIKYEIWCSTDHGNKRLDDAFKERYQEGGNVLLFFSVNGSGHFCGMAEMMTAVDYNSTSSVWSQDKWKGKFKVKWIYVKDVPNNKLRHIRLENNDNKSVTNSRDTQEVPNPQGIEVLQILHSYNHSTSIFDDFSHYEKKQEEEVSFKKPLVSDNSNMLQNQSPISRQYSRQNDDRDRDRDNRAGGGQQRYFGGSNYRDRNTSHRGGYHNYNEHRRFESHRPNSDYNQKEKDDADSMPPNRDNSEFNSRHAHNKFDYNRRDDRGMLRSNNRERDFPDDHKGEARFRAGPRDTYIKDNEHQIADRNRDTDY